MKSALVFISTSPSPVHYIKKLGIDWFQSKGVGVEFWDLSRLYFSAENISLYYSGAPGYKFKYSKAKEFHNRAEVVNSIAAATPNCMFCIINLPYANHYWILRLFKKYNINYFTQPMSPYLPLAIEGNRNLYHQCIDSIKNNTFVLKVRNKIFSLATILYQFVHAKTCFYQKPVFSMSSGTKDKDFWRYVFQPKVLYSVPSIDILWDSVPPLASISQSYCVYVDEAVDNAPDKLLLEGGNGSVVNNSKLFHKRLCSVFDTIERVKKMPVVIAGSGKYLYQDNSIFGNRKIIYSKTAQLIHNSSMVIGHKSQVLLQAIVDGKPIILLTDNTLLRVKNQNIVGMANLLNLSLVLMEDVDEEYVDLIDKTVVDHSKFIKDYLREKNCITDWKKIVLGHLK